mmetsp:Transcript_65066/g.127957  ORF Transcript_65066/g.127957 Transcript_65066/m.127957 type:complete len:206 (-) Transcript_65066:543-1160(-)
MVRSKSPTVCSSSSGFRRQGFSLFSNSALWLAMILSLSTWSLKGSTTAESGAARASASLKRLVKSSLAVIISTFTNASRRPMAICSAFSRKDCAKFNTTCWKFPTVMSMPRGDEGLGKSSPKKRPKKTSMRYRKSLSMCAISPSKAGFVTFNPGWGKPKLSMLRKVLARRSTRGFASLGTRSGSKWSCLCSRICARQSSKVKPSS